MYIIPDVKWMYHSIYLFANTYILICTVPHRMFMTEVTSMGQFRFLMLRLEKGESNLDGPTYTKTWPKVGEHMPRAAGNFSEFISFTFQGVGVTFLQV